MNGGKRSTALATHGSSAPGEAVILAGGALFGEGALFLFPARFEEGGIEGAAGKAGEFHDVEAVAASGKEENGEPFTTSGVKRRRSRVGTARIEEMATVHMTESEVARDLRAVLAKVREGVEVVVERDHRTVAVIRAPILKGRPLSECVALAEARGTTAIPEEGFMRDVAEGIAERSKPWIPPPWE